MKMIKKMKLSTLISLSLGLISFLCMTVLVIFISTRVSGVVREQAVGNMTTALEGQANLIEQFVADSELALKEYATAYQKAALRPRKPRVHRIRSKVHGALFCQP